MRVEWPVRIAGLGHALPPKAISHEELATWLGVSPFDTLRASGVSTRYHVDYHRPGATELGALAAREAIAEATHDDATLPELVINASGTQARSIPDGSALLMRALGERVAPHASGLSVHTTCLSFLSGLQVAGSLIAAGTHRRILVVSTEAASVGLDPRDLETAALIGDAAAAAVLERAAEGSASGIEAVHFETFPEGTELTRVRGGGTDFHPLAAHTRDDDNYFRMDGRALLKLVMRRLPGFLDAVYDGDVRDVDHIVPHQASPATFAVLSRLGFPMERVHRSLEELGNTVAASIPSTLYRAVRAGTIGRGDRVLLLGSGAGVTLGAIVLRF